MGLGDVLERALDGPQGRVALPVVAPLAGLSGVAGRLARCRPAAHGQVAVGIRTLLVVGVEVYVGKLQHLEPGYVLGRGYGRPVGPLRGVGEGDVPLVAGVPAAVAYVAQIQVARVGHLHVRVLDRVHRVCLYIGN